MRKLLGILGVAWVLSGCNDSTQDVTKESVANAQAPPDTVIVTDSVTVELYFANNPRAIASEGELWAHGAVQEEFERFFANGYVPGEEGAWLVRAVTIDGHTGEATLFPFVDDKEAPIGGVVHLRLDGRTLVVPLGKDPTDPWLPNEPLGDRGNGGPDLSIKTLFNSCIVFASALYQSCLGLCGSSGVPASACRKSCTVTVLASLITCILFSIFP